MSNAAYLKSQPYGFKVANQPAQNYKGRQSVEFALIQQKKGDVQMNVPTKSEADGSMFGGIKKFFSFGTQSEN